MKNFEPSPGLADRHRCVPRWRSTILRQVARPMPVPSYSLRLCSRWKIVNIWSLNWLSKPMPLSSIGSTAHAALPTGSCTGSSSSAVILMTGLRLPCGTSAHCRSGSGAADASACGPPSMAGSSPNSTVASVSSMRICRSESTAVRTSFSDTFCEWLGSRGDARIGQQIVDQLAHAAGRILHAIDEHLAFFRQDVDDTCLTRRSPKASILRSGSCRSCDAT